jgi:hypothetical protein
MKIFYLAFLSAFLIQSCEIDNGKDSVSKPFVDNRLYGFEGYVIEEGTKKLIDGCKVLITGQDFKPLTVFSDSLGYFNASSNKGLYAEGEYQINITHPLYGLIIRKETRLWANWLNKNIYWCCPPGWINIFLKTKKKLSKNDIVGYYFGEMELPDQDYYFVKGSERENIDTILRFKINMKEKDSYGMYGAKYIFRDSILTKTELNFIIYKSDTVNYEVLL